ncbi:hypothetical protein FFWV33_02405 [Flavobacterium faecale]|uniref:Uncharacterized protein n=1 Tax=Flavobacterium faecale TaxID=1355330 RepID=A0A2S1L9L4_9FLAO|nr:hypothetical protein [Flavobacterium faecale]AWG20460.1 hypothetical protein FFWV33_02405 [Flavobacterium faecale]
METKVPNIDRIEMNTVTNDVAGYYLVSTRWTMINDENITFVRNETLGYCYNLNWAGPMHKSDAMKGAEKNKTTRVISHAALKPFLSYLNDQIVLPNIHEVRELLNLDSDQLQLIG